MNLQIKTSSLSMLQAILDKTIIDKIDTRTQHDCLPQTDSPKH